MLKIIELDKNVLKHIKFERLETRRSVTSIISKRLKKHAQTTSKEVLKEYFEQI